MTDDEKQALANVPLMGPKMVSYLEAIGIDSIHALRTQEAAALRMAINAHLGKPHINTMGERALANAVKFAQDF